MKEPDLLAVIRPVAEAFEKLGAFYYIGGSIASSAYGAARATLDVDMASDLKPQYVDLFVKMLDTSYYIDKDAILEAIRKHSSFNLIHLDTIFIIEDKPYPRQALSRRRKETLDEDQHAAEFYFASSEDIVLIKLDWYRIGGEVSERQWSDVIGVLKIQDKALDKDYLRHWASELKLSYLLEKAFQDAGIHINELQ